MTDKNKYKFSEEDIEKAVDEMIEELKEKEKKLNVFRKSREDEVMEEIYQYLINSEDEKIDEIISIYKIVSKWIKNKENIYWWQYL